MLTLTSYMYIMVGKCGIPTEEIVAKVMHRGNFNVGKRPVSHLRMVLWKSTRRSRLFLSMKPSFSQIS